MAIRKYKPTSPGRRSQTASTFDEITTNEPYRPLTEKLGRTGGRNNAGHLTSWWRGGGHKRQIRLIDFKRNKIGVPGRVAAIEYDPGRSARIALVFYVDGDKRYMLAPDRLEVGLTVISADDAPIAPGNSLPLSVIPVGTQLHNVELQPGRGGQLGRSAGASIQLMAKESGYALLRLPSGEMRQVQEICRATIGAVGNSEHSQVKLGKAGRTRHRGRRPQVRGSAMNPVDHPHGGGEGKAPVGLPGPKTPWGKPALGYRTRTNKRTGTFIVRRRGRRRR